MVVGERGDQRAGDVGGRARELDPERRALPRGLDDQRERQPVLDRRQRVGRAERLERRLRPREEVRRRQARRRGTRAWRAPCPSSGCTPRRPSPVYGMPSTSSSSCTVPSSPSRPCSATNATSGASARRRWTRSWPTSIAIDLVAERLERVLDARARAQRDVALQRAPALEDRDAAHPPRAGAACRTLSGRRRSCGGRVAAGGAARRRRPGQRLVQLDLLAHDLADPPHALADVVVADAAEVQPHRVRRRARRGTPRGRARTRRSPAARARAGRSCRGTRAASPTGTARPRDASTSTAPGSARPARRASRRAGAGRAGSATPR